MAGLTNRGKFLLLDSYFSGTTVEAPFNMALILSTSVPTCDTNQLSELNEVPAGNGYTALGVSIAQDGVDAVTTENDTTNRANTVIKDCSWTAVGGAIPASGGGSIRYVVLLDGHATTPKVIAFWDIGVNFTLVEGQTLTLSGFKLTLME